MHSAIQSRFFRLIYSSPKQGNILAGIIVSVKNFFLAIFICTFENLICSLSNVFAYMTHLTGICRGNNNQLNPGKNTLVFQKRTKLMKIPFAKFYSKGFISFFRSKTNTSQIFNSNSFTLFFSKFYNRFRNGVINYCCRCFFFTRKPFGQFPAIPFCGTFGSVCLYLDRTTYILFFFSIVIEPFSRIFNIIRGGYNIGKTKVNTDKLFHIRYFFIRYFYRLKQIKFSFFINKISLALNIRKIISVVTYKWKFFQTTTDCPNGNGIIWSIRKNSWVVSHASQRSKCTFGFFVQLICIRHFADAAYNYLSRKIGGLFNRMINFIVNFKLIKNSFFPNYIRNYIASQICFLNGIKQIFRLFICGKKFYFKSQFHSYINSTKKLKIQILEKTIIGNAKAGAFLPSTLRDEWVSCTYIL